MKLTSGSGRKPSRPLSLRALLLLTLASGCAVVLVVALLLVGASTALHQAVAIVARDTRSVGILGEIESELLTYTRTSNLLVTMPAPSLEPLRATARHRIRRLLDQAGQYAGSADEREQVQLARQQLDLFFARREAAEAAGRPLSQIIRETSPLITRAAATLDALQALNQAELDQAQARAARMDSLSNIAGLLAIALIIGGIALFTVGFRRYLIQPLLRLHRAMERFRQGDRTVRAPEQGPHEIGQIGHVFNCLTEALVRQRRAEHAFMAGVAHDLRNPLAAIHSAVTAARRQSTPDPDRTARCLTIVDRQVEALSQMLADLLDAARIEAGDLELRPAEHDAREKVLEVVELYRLSAPGREIRATVPATPLIVSADPLRIAQVVGNLINNAIKYSPDGGVVDVRLSADDRHLVLSVTDEGVGIAADELNDIFMPFRRGSGRASAQPGTGLGLSVARRIVTAHGGQLEVQSSPGAGSAFHVRLPLAGNAAAHLLQGGATRPTQRSAAAPST